MESPQNTWNGCLFTVVEAPLMKLPYSINYHYGGGGEYLEEGEGRGGEGRNGGARGYEWLLEKCILEQIHIKYTTVTYNNMEFLCTR